MKNTLFSILLFIFSCPILMGQESNIFYSEPDIIKQFLGKEYKKIEIEIIKSKGNEPDIARIPGESAYRIIKFVDANSCQIIDKTKDNESDTTFYKYDKCGNLVLKKGHTINSKYSNRYKNCKLISKESNEWDISNGSDHQWNLIRYEYDKNSRLNKELIYDFYDTTTLKFSNEYKYKGNNLDSLNEYYYDEDGAKLKNRMTKYFYGSKLESVHYYSSDFYLIDKRDYQYDPLGKLISVKEKNNSQYIYSYNSKNELESILAEMDSKDYRITYFE